MWNTSFPSLLGHCMKGDVRDFPLSRVAKQRHESGWQETRKKSRDYPIVAAPWVPQGSGTYYTVTSSSSCHWRTHLQWVGTAAWGPLQISPAYVSPLSPSPLPPHDVCICNWPLPLHGCQKLTLAAPPTHTHGALTKDHRVFNARNPSSLSWGDIMPSPSTGGPALPHTSALTYLHS